MNYSNFLKRLSEIESKWLPVLYKKTKEEFDNRPLPSHDHTHHLRVWFYARELLAELCSKGYKFDENELLKAIIAVFFHDVGLTRTLNPDHGKESRRLCENFLTTNTNILPEVMDDVLEAIEMHDDKSYLDKRNKTDTYTILTISDDLDAYGAIGVYRYFEIYRLRGISQYKIPELVIENLENRFRFLIDNFGELDTYIQKQYTRKQYTANFYRQIIHLEIELQQHAVNTLQILDQLMEKAIEKKNGLDFLLHKNNELSIKDEFYERLISDIKKELLFFKDAFHKLKIPEN